MPCEWLLMLGEKGKGLAVRLTASGGESGRILQRDVKWMMLCLSKWLLLEHHVVGQRVKISWCSS